MCGAIEGDNKVYTHYARWKTHPNSTIRVWLIPWCLAGRSFPPSGSVFSSTSRHAHALHVTDDGKTWQSCAMPGHPGQSNRPGRRKEVCLKINKFLDKQEDIMQPFTTSLLITTRLSLQLRRHRGLGLDGRYGHVFPGHVMTPLLNTNGTWTSVLWHDYVWKPHPHRLNTHHRSDELVHLPRPDSP